MPGNLAPLGLNIYHVLMRMDGPGGGRLSHYGDGIRAERRRGLGGVVGEEEAAS